MFFNFFGLILNIIADNGNFWLGIFGAILTGVGIIELIVEVFLLDLWGSLKTALGTIGICIFVVNIVLLVNSFSIWSGGYGIF